MKIYASCVLKTRVFGSMGNIHGVVAMAGLKKMDQFLLALVCMAVVPLVNGKPYSISACNQLESKIACDLPVRPSVRTRLRSTIDSPYRS